jgi:hypothetical protein
MAPVFRRRLVIRAHRHRPGVVIALVSLLTATVVAWGLSAHEAVAQTNGGAAVRADFQQRLDRYMELRGTLLKKGLQPEHTADVGYNRSSQQALALRIRAGRRNARQGEILTPAIAAMLRSAMNPEVRGVTAAGTRASIRDDAPPRFALHVNDRYPDGASRSTVPGNVLAVLPPLPDGLEYRVVDNHLILLDVDAAVVLDYLFNVMCARC